MEAAFQSTLPARGATLTFMVSKATNIFQSTLPARGATGFVDHTPEINQISIHAPRTGSDRGQNSVQHEANYFNPRSPHGERLNLRKLIFTFPFISIHAPRTGSDDFVDSLLMQCGISIHAPRTGSDVSPAPIPASAPLFQSTLPARGATLACNFCGIACHISIHAPRTGSDGECLGAEILDSQFQSTLPARGATRHFLNCKRTHRFQSTLPARGATVAGFAAGKIAQISIHAPRTGSDHTSKVTKGVSRYFNPRSPHGERHSIRMHLYDCNHFNPRSPHGERPSPAENTLPSKSISIHAPRTGSDRFPLAQGAQGVLISIHAPRTGSDRGTRPSCASDSPHFNPRSPHGERPRCTSRPHCAADFNPRSPHGERRRASCAH